jgi:hypothetical protein
VGRIRGDGVLICCVCVEKMERGDENDVVDG